MDSCHERVYLPPAGNFEISTREYLREYICKEFPYGDSRSNVYSVPKEFLPGQEKQASMAESTVFDRLHGLKNLDLWMLFFHGTSYAGRSQRNHRIGKLTIREHDFVMFTKYKSRFFVSLAEVKSVHDAATKYTDVSVTGDARVVKNNKRSAQHQLRDHVEMIEQFLEGSGLDDCIGSIQNFIMWPFLSPLTKDPKQVVIKRWKEDGSLHVFEDCLQEQRAFDAWFLENVLNNDGCDEKFFNTMLNRFIVLSCGVFVDEIHRGMLALLTQNQLALLTTKRSDCIKDSSTAQVVHGAAGTGKTLLVIKKLQLLYEQGELNENKRALYICYWPGIKQDLENKLRRLSIDQYVDTARFYISQTGFLLRNKSKYKHIFMDEAEAICLAFENVIMMRTISEIYQRYHDGNCSDPACSASTKHLKTTEDCSRIFDNHNVNDRGELWFLVDINQASLFLPKHSPNILKKPNVVLNRVMRSTGYIFNVFKQFYTNPFPMLRSVSTKMNLDDIDIGHGFDGPPIFWVDRRTSGTILDTLVHVVIDLFATKGIKPNNLCVIPFMASEKFSPDAVNVKLEQLFVESGYRPKAVGDVEDFVTRSEPNDFLIAWALRVKGLEFKTVVIVLDDDEFDINDIEDRNKMYIMSSRCTCLLVIVSPKETRLAIDNDDVIKNYRFDLQQTTT